MRHCLTIRCIRTNFCIDYSIVTYPGMYGPNPEKLEGSVELEIAANVLPQKLFSQKIILAWFSGIPLTI